VRLFPLYTQASDVGKTHSLFPGTVFSGALHSVMGSILLSLLGFEPSISVFEYYKIVPRSLGLALKITLRCKDYDCEMK
jgi:hypothetical protein